MPYTPRNRIGYFLILLLPLLACRLSFIEDTTVSVFATPTPILSPTPTNTPEAATRSAQALLATPPPTAVVPPQPTSITLAQTAPLIGPNLSYEGTLNAGNAAVYQLNAPASSALLIAVSPQNGLDATLQISNDQAIVIATADDNGQNEPDFIRLDSPTAASYTIRVAPFAEGTTGSYTLTVYDLNSANTNYAINITDTVSDGNVNNYYIDQPAGQLVLIFFEPAADLDGLVEVYEPSGFLFNQDEGNEGESETAVFTTSQDGEYLIRIFGYLGDSGDYTLRVLTLP